MKHKARKFTVYGNGQLGVLIGYDDESIEVGQEIEQEEQVYTVEEVRRGGKMWCASLQAKKKGHTR